MLGLPPIRLLEAVILGLPPIRLLEADLKEMVGRTHDTPQGRKTRGCTCQRNQQDPTRPKGVVGRGGLEPPTSRLSGVRSNHLSYRP